MSDGISDDRWALAEVIYTARIEDAWGGHKESRPPERKGYTHQPVADFDLALACAKEVLNRYELKRKEIA